MPTLQMAVAAMATRFEFVLIGPDETALRAAGDEATEEIRRQESRLSFYNPRSELSRINAAAGKEPIRVDGELFDLLERAVTLSEATDGAFDPTVSPLMALWGMSTGRGRRPTDEELSDVLHCVGRLHVELDRESQTVRLKHPRTRLDFGGIGKGFALDAAKEVLTDCGIEHGLIHGGTSTVLAWGEADAGTPWKIAVEDRLEAASADATPEIAPDRPRQAVTLNGEALSVSAGWGKERQVDGETIGHVLDPRTGRPVKDPLLAAVVARSATDADALSTALLTLGVLGQSRVSKWPGVRQSFVLMSGGDDGRRWHVG